MKQASKKKVRKIAVDGDDPSPAKPVRESYDTAYFIAEATLEEEAEPIRPAVNEEMAAAAMVPPSPPLAPMAALWPSPAAAAVTKATTQPASTNITVTFVLREPDAKQVMVCGEFNGWSPTATPMKGRGDGHWETTIVLAPGRYQYKFVVDGNWIPDPLARENVSNQQGTLNSVIEVRE